jgi:hypothetical protein
MNINTETDMTSPTTIKLGDVVRLLPFHEKSPNAYARVVDVEEDGIRVSNMNMPWMGTCAFEWFNLDAVRVVEPKGTPG